MNQRICVMLMLFLSVPALALAHSVLVFLLALSQVLVIL